MTISIIDIGINEDSILWGYDKTDVDVSASLARFADHVRTKIESLYPNTDITISIGANSYIRIDGQTDHPEEGWVSLGMDEVHQYQDWVELT